MTGHPVKKVDFMDPTTGGEMVGNLAVLLIVLVLARKYWPRGRKKSGVLTLHRRIVREAVPGSVVTTRPLAGGPQFESTMPQHVELSDEAGDHREQA